MQTRFTTEQLAQPEVAAAEPILKSCVHYGFCTATCPTYVLTRDENDGPRGRIDLIRAMLEKGGTPDARTVHYLDRCLSCLGCMTTCAVKVDYHHLIDIARARIERDYRRPIAERVARELIAWTIPNPRRMALALWLARFGGIFRGVLPKPVRSLIDMAPPAREIDGQITRPGSYPAEGTARRRVVLLTGCAQQALDRSINEATIRVLRRLGCDVIVPEAIGCCGALTLHMGREHDGRARAANVIRRVIGARASGNIDAVIVNASGCGTVVKDYGHVFGREPALAPDAAWVSSITRDVSEVVAELGLPPAVTRRAYRVAYHDACSLRHGQKITDPPRQLLRQCGYDVVDVPEAHICCGSAGVYNVLQPELAGELGQRKAKHIASTDPHIAAMGNIGCMTQLRRHGTVPIVHTIELIDWATGGPMPSRLAHANLPEPPASPEIASTSTADPSSGGSSGAIW